jgi:mTERF domain-containing protein
LFVVYNHWINGVGNSDFIFFQITSTVLGIAVKSWPHILGCSTKRMNSILVLLADLGVSKKMLIPLLTSSPQLLLRKPNDILQVHSYMYALSI